MLGYGSLESADENVDPELPTRRETNQGPTFISAGKVKLCGRKSRNVTTLKEKEHPHLPKKGGLVAKHKGSEFPS